MLGDTVAHYKVESPLGQGGMGVVYLATDLRLRRQVAIKFAGAEQMDEAGRLALQAEAVAASQLTHANIAQIYALDETVEGQPFFVMEYVAGRTLADELRQGPIRAGRVLEIVHAVAEALQHAHSRGIVHRDIKPGNIQITPEGQVKVLDFGLAHRAAPAGAELADATLTMAPTQMPGRLSGSPGYMSPEQAAGRASDARSDLFSLGCVFFEALTGQKPFATPSLAEYLSALHGSPAPVPSSLQPDIPPYVDGIVLRLLAKPAEQRFQSAAELLAALEVGPGRLPPARLAGRQRLLWLAAATVVLAAVGLAGYAWATRPYQPGVPALRWYRQGLAALRDGTYLKASKALAEAVKLDPDFALARAHLAEAWIEMDYGDRAKEEMIRLRRIGISGSRLSRADRLHVEGIDFLVTGDVKETIARYQAMLPLVDGEQKAGAWVDLGRAYERAGQRSEAVASFEQAIAVDPQGAAAHLRRGLLLRRARRLDDAETAFQRAGQLYQAASDIEGVTEVQYARGALQLDREQPEVAQRLLNAALASARVTGNAQQQVKILLQLATLAVREGAGAESDRLANQALALARADGVENLVSRALISLGGAWFQRDKDEAERYYSTALEIARRNRAVATEARAQLALGSLHSSMGQAERAVAELKPAAAYFAQTGYVTDAFQASLLLGRTQRDLGDYDGAERVFRGLLSGAGTSGSNEELALLHEAVGLVLLRKEDYRAALNEFEQAHAAYTAARSVSGAAYLLAGRASALWRLGDYGAAAQLLDQAEAAAAGNGSSDLATAVRLERLQMAVSQRRYGDALVLAGRLETARPALAERDRVQLAVLGVRARAASGGARAAVSSCSDLLGSARGPLRAQWQLGCAQAALDAGEPAQAATWAAGAAPAFEAAGQLESAWRAAAVRARAGDAAASVAASAALNRMKQGWQTADYARFLARPDVRQLR